MATVCPSLSSFCGCTEMVACSLWIMPSPWATNHGPYPSAAVGDAKFKLLLIFKALRCGYFWCIGLLLFSFVDWGIIG